jgi:hypothetical protein
MKYILYCKRNNRNKSLKSASNIACLYLVLFSLILNDVKAVEKSLLNIKNSNIDLKEFVVPKIRFTSRKPTPEMIAGKFEMEKIPFQKIDCVNWKEFPYKPETEFRMAYSKNELYLQFKVHEKYIKAKCKPGDNSCFPSYDSCVEFFFSPGSDSTYYNFEFSCIGYCLIQYGKPGKDRKRISSEITDLVRTESSLGSETFDTREGDFHWCLTVAIPFSVIKMQNPPIEGQKWKANFYKCGDNLPEKAYLSWNPVNTPNPNFHSPQHFGTIKFE